MDEYDKKFAEMQKYIPFLEAMIERLQKVKDKSREAQLQKMQSLHGILSNSKRKLRIETLQRCEDVLQKLHNKVEKGNTTGLNPTHKKAGENSSQNTSSKEKPSTKSSVKPHMEMMDNETPASPSPTASPDHMSKSAPIIIPMERRDEENSKCDSKPASPDQCEHVPVTAPIIIPTERKDESKADQSSINHNSNNCGSDSNELFSEWEMLEESENQINKSRRNTWQSVIAPGTDVAAAAKIVCNNLPQKVIPDSRPHIPMAPRHIPTVPAPSLGGLRRIMSVFDKNRLGSVNATSVHSESRPQSPVNVPEVRLKSPDPDLLFPRLKITSPRQKEGVNLPKLSPKPSTPLLVSPPSVLTEPPLSIEDLAELLSDEGDGSKRDKVTKGGAIEEKSKTAKEVGGEDIGKSKKETLPGKNLHKNHKDSNDSKVPNSFVLTQEDIDRESERRWEEIDKHIVKLTARRCLPNKHTISPLSVRLESSRASESKLALSPPRISQPMLSPGLSGVDKSVDHRNRPPSPLLNIMKEKENEKEHRYADNYERHPRQFRDAHDSGDDIKDKNTVSSNLSRLTDDQLGNMGFPNLRNNTEVSSKPDDNTRNVPLYQRRSQPNSSVDATSPLGRSDEYRRENVDYFARNSGTKTKRQPLLPSPIVPDFPNTQWGSTPSYSGNIRPPLPPAPNAYQRTSNNTNFHQEMWQMGPGCAPPDFHQMNETEPRIPQFNPHPPIRPLNNSTPRMPDINRGINSEGGFREETSGPAPVIQPMLSPPGFPSGTQYRNPRMENRAYDMAYDRSSDISQTRHTWDSSSNRVNDGSYRREGESPRGRSTTEGPICRPGTPAPYARPGTPCPLWPRERERNEKEWNRRGRGRERYYNDRGRSESRGQFNRDSRRSEWERDGHNERDNNRVRLNRDNRVSERDPRVRPEQPPQSPAPPKETVTTATVRDPRLIKDTSNVVDKPKDTVVSSADKNPRRRISETKGTRKSSPTGIQPKAKDKTKAQKLIESKNRRDSEYDDATSDKIAKDKLHSPLESLYGVIDTKAKTGQGYGLQKFKIPKIKRPDPPPPPPKPDPVIPEIKVPEATSSSPEQLPETSYQNIRNDRDDSDQNTYKADGEIGSTDDASCILPVNTLKREQPNNVMHVEADSSISTIPKVIQQTGEGISKDVSTSKEPSEQVPEGEFSKESDAPKPKEEVTKEWIEALIRKSFEFGQGKQLFDQAKLLHKLGEALHAKKLKKIKKIIESDSESSSSSKDEEIVEARKPQGKKKRRVIFSDSSDEESLADRLGLLKDSTNEPGTLNETPKEEVKDKTENAAKTDSQRENLSTLTAISKIADEPELQNAKEDRETHDTSVVVEEVALPVARKKRAYRKRGKGPKKIESNVEEAMESKPAQLSSPKDEQKPGGNEEIEIKAPQKTKNKRRNSLEMLQEDIREMFISEGVVTATGHRMCRLIKEGNSNLNSSVQNLPNSSSDMSKSDDKQNAFADSDTDEINSLAQPKKDDSISVIRGRLRPSKSTQAEDAKGPHTKTQKRTSKRASKVISRQYVDSSDSDDDEPLIKSVTRTESLKSLSDSETTAVTEQNETQQKSETRKSEESQAVMFLRRSKRVPRVLVEKTEITKLDSSKMMFDSSSDESFGIDVSELAAAVDISLHPEPQSQPDPDTPESPKASRRQTRMQTTSKQKQTSKKNKSTKIIEDKADDALSFTDEGSMLSDISMSSSITSLKKMTRNSNSRNSTKGQQDTNEELMSNILIGLTAKSIPEKSTDEVDKESDADADEELDENACETSEGIKKGATKRKKKKFNWQLGILSKKKKKKKASAPRSPIIPASELEFADPSESLNKTVPTYDDKTAEGNSFDALNEVETSSLSKKSHSSKPTKMDTGLQECNSTDAAESANSKSSSKSVEKQVGIEQGEIENSIISERCGDAQMDTGEDQNFSEIKNLIEYAWTGQERYKCMLCTFTGKNIVHHYKTNHPLDEVLISRLVSTTAKSAIEEANNINMGDTRKKLTSEEMFEYNCRFCLFSTNGTREIARESFYEHCTTHTGEYRFKCASCPYQTVAKSSLKSHYYKVCRKFSENVSVAIIEDSIPDEDNVHGYICSICNFVQLQKSNVETHMASKHNTDSTVKCIQINMSSRAQEGPNIESHSDPTNKDNLVEMEQSAASEKGRETMTKKSDHLGVSIDKTENKDIEEVQINDRKDDKEANARELDVKTEVEQQTNFAVNSSHLGRVQEKAGNVIVLEALADEKKMETDSTTGKTCSEQGSEALPVNGNLSAFVCPPEVAIKEREIQLERKKKMQEIVENIGIKVNKDGTKQPLSIIDKLKVKMDTNSKIDNDQNVIEKKDNLLKEISEQSQSSLVVHSSQLDMENLSNKESESSIDAKSLIQVSLQPGVNINLLSSCSEAPSSEDNMDKSSNNLETKIKDPLTTFDDTFPNFGSDTETSDTEIMSTFVQYESDSSNEPSESQISQDMNSLLKETTTDTNAPAKGLMHITIQRLAAQLQNSKTGSSSQALNDAQVKVETSGERIIPKTPDAIPLSSVKLLWNKQETKSEEIKHEKSEASSPPKTLIRLRRLSGDKLSVPSIPVEVQEENQLSSTEGSASDLGTGVLQTDTEEECSFLRIENVVSLAPAADDAEGESSIISDIRKAVETSPIKPRVSILKKSPIILQKVGNRSVLNQRLMNSMNNTGESVKIIPLKSLPSTSQAPKQVLANIIPMQSPSKIQVPANLKKPLYVPTIIKKGATSTTSTQIQPTANITLPVKPNFKIIKLTRTATLLKHKESIAQSVAIKLKSADAYRSMLKPAKLCHLFKCMARDCSYTTNSIELFKNHYEEHMTVCIKENMNRPFGCQNCAYCCTVLEDWNLMEKHLLSRHAYCQYQCSYCFYRAVTQSYVELHQAISHPGCVVAVLQGIAIGDNIPDDCIDRSEIVKPFICQQECGKSFYIPETFMTHLKTVHGPLLSMYKCHLCPATCLKPEKLVSHYKMHGIYKYQCMYCLNGSDLSWELHNHLSNFHCNLRPYVIERTLQPQASNGQDVIDKLVVKNVEEDFKYTDLVTNIEDIPEENWQLAENLSQNDGLNSSENSSSKSSAETLLNDRERGGKISLLRKNLYSRFCENNDSDSSVTGAAIAHYSIQHSKDNESLSNRISIPEGDDFDEYSLQLNVNILPDKLPSVKSTDNSISQDLLDNGSQSESSLTFEYPATNKIDICQTIRNSQRLVKPPDFGGTLFVINNAVDPLSLPDDPICSDQFINDNTVENSASPKKFVKDEPSNSLPASMDITSKKAQNCEDSDIEILEEDIEIVKKSNKKEITVSQEVDTGTRISKNNSINSDKVEEARVSDIKSTADNSNADTESNTNSETSMEIPQPLTLDDIKDTGFTGNNLYKCGNDDCNFNSETAELLKCHLTSCTLSNEGKSLSCAHCKKRFVKVGFLLEHLKTHGLKRFGCSLCKMRCTMPYQAMSHMKSKHKYGTSKLVPADPKNPSSDGLFVVQPIRGVAEKGRGKKRTPTKALEKDTDKCIDVEKLSFNPDEIDTLPRQAIYNREALCAVCPYSTKVRTNMIRHLQLHAKDATVPESGPVNPVPCLDKKERMFDKMVNLASSSHQNGRMGGKQRETGKEEVEDASLPKFVPEHKRYVCGVAECNYLTVDDTMLRCHLKALHSDEPYFRCPHCPLPQPGQETQNIGIDKMGIHLKMHDTRLYKCSHCNHHHYHRHVVERHLSDKHAEKRPFVKVIREPESNETPNTVQDEVEDEGPDRDGNHWKCNLCDYKCIYKNEMISHASTEHDERSQFKCSECSYKTTGKINVEQHFVSRHPAEAQIKYDMVYQKIKGGVKKAGESTDHSTTDEPFDTTPLWRRDMPRVRHIRGILLEEEEAAAANESPIKGTKRKSEGGDISSSRPAKSRPGKSTPGEVTKLSDEKTKPVTPRTPDTKKGADPYNPANERASKTRAVDKLRLLDKSENDKFNESLEVPVTDTSFSEEFSELSDSDMGQFGPYGKPNGCMYVCTLCSYFETRYKHDLRDHLYRELKYKKWHCRACGFLSVNKHTLVKHFSKQHPGEHPDHEMLTPDNSIEEWVNTLLQRQTNIIKGISNKSSPRINADKTAVSGPQQVSTQSKKAAKEVNPAVQSALKTTEDNSKTVDLTNVINNLKDSSVDVDMDLDVDDEDSRDNDDLVIDLKDDNFDESDVQDEKTISEKSQDKKENEKLLICKHCNMKFARWRGFKVHVQVTHLKRLGFLCPYCDRSTNSELTMRQHIRAKHPGSIEKIVHNPAAGGPELTSEFWEKEYGLVCPNKNNTKKRKRKPSADDVNKSKDEADKNTRDVCNLCGFSAMNLTGLKAHMRMHANKSTLKCAYCTFSGSVDAEIWQHWKVNHPHSPFKTEELSTAGPSSQNPSLGQQNKESIEEYSDDIEEEQVPSATNALEKLVYCCFYCSLRSSSLDTVRTHWEMLHREAKGVNEPLKWKTGLPFRYKQMKVPVPPPQKLLQCGYCDRQAGKATLRVHMRRKHSKVPPLFLEVPPAMPEGWVCQWCNELCETENKMKHHQNMFHSHLPLHFKKQESEEKQKEYSCPECSFTTTSIEIMRKHVVKHVNLFKCKYCDTTFTTPGLVESHSTQAHPGSELKIESISNYDSLVEKMMAKVLLKNSQQLVKSEILAEPQVTSPLKRNAVAKKSTAKPPSRVQPTPTKMRCVARKSTNSLSRYPPGVRFATDMQSAASSQDSSPSRKVGEFSYYGVPSTPISLASLNTYMSVGGHQMKVNCTTLGQLMNINPMVLVKDLKQDVKSLSVFLNRT